MLNHVKQEVIDNLQDFFVTLICRTIINQVLIRLYHLLLILDSM
jgi:hypothetical protein